MRRRGPRLEERGCPAFGRWDWRDVRRGVCLSCAAPKVGQLFRPGERWVTMSSNARVVVVLAETMRRAPAPVKGNGGTVLRAAYKPRRPGVPDPCARPPRRPCDGPAQIGRCPRPRSGTGPPARHKPSAPTARRRPPDRRPKPSGGPARRAGRPARQAERLRRDPDSSPRRPGPGRPRRPSQDVRLHLDAPREGSRASTDPVSANGYPPAAQGHAGRLLDGRGRQGGKPGAETQRSPGVVMTAGASCPSRKPTDRV